MPTGSSFSTTPTAPKGRRKRSAWRAWGRRKDVHTLDAHAWALVANGETARARQEIETALAVGIRDARILYHAGVIAAKDGDPGMATRYLEESLTFNPFSDVASAARDSLASLKSAAAPRPTIGRSLKGQRPGGGAPSAPAGEAIYLG